MNQTLLVDSLHFLGNTFFFNPCGKLDVLSPARVIEGRKGDLIGQVRSSDMSVIPATGNH